MNGKRNEDKEDKLVSEYNSNKFRSKLLYFEGYLVKGLEEDDFFKAKIYEKPPSGQQ